MTDQEAYATYEIRFSGRQYLCVPEAEYPTREPPPAMVQPLSVGLGQGEIRARVTAAMPGTTRELMMRAGVSMKAVYAVLSHWSRQQRLVTSGRYGSVTYAVLPETSR